MHHSSTIENLAHIRKLTGASLRLRTFEEVRLVQVKSPELVYVMVSAVKSTEGRYGAKIVATGTSLHIFTKSEGSWEVQVIESWDEAPAYDFVRTSGRGMSPQEAHEQSTWEDLCYRPGTAKSPMERTNI